MASDDYVMTVRGGQGGQFNSDIGPTRFLTVPSAAPVPLIAHAGPRVPWYTAVRTAGEWTNDDGQPRGDILIFVHGYNSSPQDILERHRRLKSGLAALEFKGVVVSFDWPCDDQALAYLQDRHNAKQTAMQLVSDGIFYLSKAQGADCTVNVHVLGHSTGAYVIREAFDDADDSKLENGAWMVSQVLLAAGDISSAGMAAGDRAADSVYRHCVRLTNYWNRYDQVLDISNVKRAGLSPRVGRIGLPPDAPAQAVNVDCSAYYALLTSSAQTQATDQPEGFVGEKCHSWYFGNKVFERDLFETIIGIDRNVVAQRTKDPVDGHILLK